MLLLIQNFINLVINDFSLLGKIGAGKISLSDAKMIKEKLDQI